jgi:hypothetical protein
MEKKRSFLIVEKNKIAAEKAPTRHEARKS